VQDFGVLILEDHFMLAVVIDEVLKKAGYENIHICGTQEEALDCMDHNNIAFAFLDFNLGNGETSQPIAEQLAAASIPFVFLSGYTSTLGIIPEGLGELGRLSKPSSEADLLKYMPPHTIGQSTTSAH